MKGVDMRNVFFIWGICILLTTSTCVNDGPVVLQTAEKNSGKKIIIRINPGEEWIHRTPFNAPPQIAVWSEDGEGNFLNTIYVSQKAATQGWVFADKNRKPDSLPAWSHRRGVRYADGLFMPTKKDPLPDAVTAATPRAQCTIITILPESPPVKRIYFEFNHSLDWNDTYRKDLPQVSPFFSEENGQPAVVYSAEIDTGRAGTVKARVSGHSDLRGRSGKIDPDVGTLSTALHIVDSITVTVE
jgi:hypothetical protein